MTCAEFLKVRKDLLNDEWIPRAHVLESTWRYMEQVPLEHIQVLVLDGSWIPHSGGKFHIGCAYRVDPNWAGPAPTTPPEPTFVDAEVKPDASGWYCFTQPDHDVPCAITAAPAIRGFIGYAYYHKNGSRADVYVDLQFGKDGLIMPDAVRFKR